MPRRRRRQHRRDPYRGGDGGGSTNDPKYPTGFPSREDQRKHPVDQQQRAVQRLIRQLKEAPGPKARYYQALIAYCHDFPADGLTCGPRDPHAGLGFLGMIPGIGEPADILNGLLYAYEGNHKAAALSLASAVPGLGLLAASRLIKAGAKCNSFVSGTKVLLANGKKTPIEKIKPGDRVIATNPKTGKTTPQTVLATLTSISQKTLIDIRLDTPDQKHCTNTSLLTATDEHPFWVTGNLRKWIKAKDLKPGMWLRTSTGTHTQITATHHHQLPLQRVHNLTTTNPHTYYALAGDTPVLVHNDGGDDLVRVGRWMSQAEYDAMKSTGMVQRGGGGFTYVVYPASPDAYISARPGSVYAEFDVSRSSLIPGGRPGDFKMSDSTTINGGRP